MILLRSNNITVVQYVNKQGGSTHSVRLFLTWELLLGCLDHGVTLRAVHVAGTGNVVADLLSGKKVSHSKWSLNERVVKCLFARLW